MLQGIGRLEAILPVTVQVALTNTDQAEGSTFSCIWHIPRLVLELASGRLALCILSFLVSDASSASEDVLIGLPVLHHLDIDSRTHLERNRAQLDETDCSSVPLRSKSHIGGSLRRLMFPRLLHVHGPEHKTELLLERSTQLDPDRPRGNCFVNKFGDEPFPDLNLMDADDPSKAESQQQYINAMIQHAKDNGLQQLYWSRFESMVREFVSTFRTSFSSTPSKVEPMHITLTPDAMPVHLRLRNYSQS